MNTKVSGLGERRDVSGDGESCLRERVNRRCCGYLLVDRPGQFLGCGVMQDVMSLSEEHKNEKVPVQFVQGSAPL